ncbi:lipopolysaccharide biosynthesis protein RfbH [Candidatus Atribacteria bacterium HGW-Atribacteria-1]|nr:MAG: lipopolysaccharide biosynthesis protein RfbH [Candidatus Atribacteria bacterium HGW-Atribacteria-1]
MERLDFKVGDIILVKDPTIGDLSDKILLVLDLKGKELLCALIDKNTNGIEITDDDLEEGKLEDRGVVVIEKLFTISPIDYQKVASLKKDSLDRILRAFTKYTSSIYFKVFHKEKSMDKIPASGKVLDEDDLFNLIDASLDMWLTAGRFAEEFEKEFPKFLGRKYCALVNSGSSANLIAISALTSYKLGERRLKPGDEVITVAAGFPTTITPIIQNNLIPVFIDVDIGTYNVNVEQLENAISEKTKAIFLAHTLGNPFDVDKVLEIAKKYNLWLIEDNCDALGSKYNDKYTGTFGHISTLSFYPAHHMTMGEGGAVLTDDLEIYRIISSFRDWGRDCWCPPGKDNTCKNRFNWKLGDLPFGYDHKYIYSHLGYNLKATDFQAAIGLTQLKKLPDFIDKRKKNFELLFEGFKKENLDKYFILPKWSPHSESSWFGFPLTIKDNTSFDRKELIEFLEKNKIGTRLLFAGNIIKQPAFTNNQINYRVFGELKNTDKIMKDTFWIGVWPELGEKKIKYMIGKFKEYIIKFKQGGF